MEIVVNGKHHRFESAMSIAELLEQLEARGPQVAVEVNAQLVPRAEHADHQLTSGDKIEIVTLVGGG